jgi:hypothetical protein
MDERWQGRVEVRQSPIHGLGVFAVRAFHAGELIFVRDETRLVTADNPLNAAKGEVEHHCDWLWDGIQVLLPSPDCYVNHSCAPNSNVIWRDDVGHNVALREIEEGEEITHSYSVNLHGGLSWQCNCGSERCIGVVPGSFFVLPIERQAELAPLLANWFIAEHRDEYEAFRRRADLI